MSKVLNRRDDVAEDTRAAVQRLPDEAGSARRGKALEQVPRLVDLVVTDMCTPWASEILRGAEDEAQQRGVGLVRDGRIGAAKLLELTDPVAAVFAGADQQATGVHAEAVFAAFG